MLCKNEYCKNSKCDEKCKPPGGDPGLRVRGGLTSEGEAFTIGQ